MQITIEMIETKEFKTKPRGYDPQEVDEFLDAICDEMARQLDAIQSLQQQLADAKAARPAPAPAPQGRSNPRAPQSFDDMLKHFLSDSESRQSDLNRGGESRRPRRNRRG